MTEVILRAVVLASVAVGCGGSPKLPSQGGSPWIEVTSDNFTMWTDANEDRAGELIREVERMRQIVVGVAFPHASGGGDTLVIALRDDDELASFSPNGQPNAFAVPRGAPPMWRPTLVLSAFSNRDPADRTLARGLTQMVALAAVKHQPRWLLEGVGMYFETVDLDPESRSADIGTAPLIRGQPAQLEQLMAVEKLLAWDWGAEGDRHHYSTAWALYTFLLNEHRAELARYVELIAHSADMPQATSDRTSAVWNAAFSSLPLVSVDYALRQWLASGRHVVVHINFEPRDYGAKERSLSDADVQEIFDMLNGWRGDR